jgi:ElaB/YqjD/DUF883 family membrane-anchored ribosome-binding protein
VQINASYPDLKRERKGRALADTDDLHRAEIRSFLYTTTEAIRYNPFCAIAIEPVVLDDFRV